MNSSITLKLKLRGCRSISGNYFISVKERKPRSKEDQIHQIQPDPVQISWQAGCAHQPRSGPQQDGSKKDPAACLPASATGHGHKSRQVI